MPSFRWQRLLPVALILVGAASAQARSSNGLHWERIHTHNAAPSVVFAKLGLTHSTKNGYTRDGKQGVPDPTFGTNGLVTSTFTLGNQQVALAVQPDGKVVVVGATSSYVGFVARYNVDGSPDASRYFSRASWMVFRPTTVSAQNIGPPR